MSDANKVRCATCQFWQPSPTTVKGCLPERICGLSRNMGSSGMYGQDGRAVITTATFGCINHKPKTS